MRVKIPGKMGGKLIRQCISEFKKNKIQLPIDSHILCAVSGGVDSIALAHLFATYGKKVVPRGVIFLHVNHNWRGVESDRDAQFVQDFGQLLRVKVIVRDLDPKQQFIKGKSPEERARVLRKEIYQDIAQELGVPFVFTGHHRDDCAETVLWKLMTGAPHHEWGGISFVSGVECRPFLNVTKSDLIQYLKEEGITHREDYTNADPRFLRAKLRSVVVPALDQVFPKWKMHLSHLTRAQTDTILPDQLGALLSLGQSKIRGKHWKEAMRQVKNGVKTSIDLPNGAKLTHNTKEGTWTLKPGNEGSN